jgi:hypothetical protein
MSGSTAVVGDPSQDAGGVVYVYGRSGDGWALTATLTPPLIQYRDSFGWSVAISGPTIVVGMPDLAEGTAAGVTYVYRFTAGSWTLVATLHAPGGSTQFGYSVAVSGDMALVGEPTASGEGPVYAYLDRVGTWTRTATLIPHGGDQGYFFVGLSVALSGAHALLGGTNAAYVFTHRDGRWSQSAVLTVPNATPGEGRGFGTTVALAGAVGVIGAPGHPVAGKRQAGTAYVLTDRRGRWSLTAGLTAPDAVIGDHFGGEVATTGTTVVVGAGMHPNGGLGTPGSPSTPGPGAAYVYTLHHSRWGTPTELTAFDGQDADAFGGAAISGNTAFITAPNKQQPGHSDVTGAVYICTPV